MASSRGQRLWVWVFFSFFWLVVWLSRVPSHDFGKEIDWSLEQGPVYNGGGLLLLPTPALDGSLAIFKENVTSSVQQRVNGGATPRDHSEKILPFPTAIALWDTSWISTSNYEAIVNETINGQETLVQLRASNKGQIRSAKVVRRELRKKFNSSIRFSSITHVETIYYINMDHRPVRRAIMESWLSKQPIPYQRVPGEKGEEDSCIPKKTGRRCIGISGLARTNVNLIDKLNTTTGIIMVVEDDFVIRDMNKLLASVHLVPPDWDVLRWDCWDPRLPHFEVYPFSFKVGVVVNPPDCKKIGRPPCTSFCGGTHVSMWRGGESLEKLRRLWGTPPHDGIDCQISHPSITSYCIQVGVGEFHIPLNEWSDIPKN